MTPPFAVAALLAAVLVTTVAQHASGAEPTLVNCTATPDNCTAVLQSLLDDPSVPHLHFDRSLGPFITLPLQLRRSNVLITCGNRGLESIGASDYAQWRNDDDDFAEVLAMRWAFNGTGDSLLTIREAENITIRGPCHFRMWRHDYANHSLYRKGEWRHALNIDAVSGLSLLGITLEESGGDGIYLGGTCNHHVTIDGVNSLNNYRQGMSVICADYLRVTRTTFAGTRGTNPECGVDFEPNIPKQQLTRVYFENNTFYNNSGCGIALSTHAFNNDTAPVEVTLIDSVIHLSEGGFGFIVSIPTRGPKGGYVNVDGMQISDTMQFGLFGMSKDLTPFLTFKRATLTNTSFGHFVAPIAFYPSFRGIFFDDTEVYEPEKKVVLYYQDGGRVKDPDVKGHITVHSPFKYDCIGVIPPDVHKTLNITCDVEH